MRTVDRIIKASIACLALTLLPAVGMADTGYFTRLGYDYPPAWGIGPFATITECTQASSSLYGADAYKWHCELRAYVGDSSPSYTEVAPAAARTPFYARLGYDYPPYWGVGPFNSLSDCLNAVSRGYSSDAFKWHCETHL